MSDRSVNVQLDRDTERKLAFLEKETGASASEILGEAIGNDYARVRNDDADPGMALIKTGFVGCGVGPVNSSTNYKKMLWADHRRTEAG